MWALKRLSGPSLLLAFIIGVWAAVQAQQTRPLGEADLIKLVELQIGDDVVVARVEKSGIAFSADAAALERLRRAGASDAVLAAVRKAGGPADAITYQGILRLLRQGAGEAEILKRLDESPTSTTFTLNPTQIAELERAGASRRLIAAMQRVRGDVAAGSDVSDFVVVLDASGSMRELTPDGRTKMDAAKEVLTRFITEIPDGKRLALVVYGSVPTQNKAVSCRDVRVMQGLLPLDGASKERLIRLIRAIRPVGATPLALAMETAGREIARSQGLCQMVVVTDGMETCDGDPGRVAADLARRPNLPQGVDIVGFGVSPREQQAVRGIVSRAGRGKYYDTQTATELGEALGRARREAQERARAEAERLARQREEAEADGDVNLPPRVKLLVEALSDEDQRTRESAAENLAKMGDRARGAAPALARLLADDKLPRRHTTANDNFAALAALKQLAPEKIEPALTKLARSKDAKLKQWALSRLAELELQEKGP